MTALSIIRADSAHWEHIEREANEHYAARVCDIVDALDLLTDCGGNAIMHYRNGGEYADF